MGENTAIEWATHTFNPWMGCTKVSPACKHCYAETLMDTRYGKVRWGKGQPRLRTSDANWKKPLKWNRDAERDGTRPRVFCASLADVFDCEVPAKWLADLLDLIVATPHLDWLLLTKRIESVLDRVEMAFRSRDGLGNEAWGRWLHGQPIPNVWLGVTVEDQRRADDRIPVLLKIPSTVRFLSIEPLLGPVLIDRWLRSAKSNHVPSGPHGRIRLDEHCPTSHLSEFGGWCSCGIDWVIVGGESGAVARPMDPIAVRSIRDQCAYARTSFLFKQWGEHDEAGRRVGKNAAGRQIDGVTHDGFPKVKS